MAKDYKVSVNDIRPIESGFIIDWRANIGFGQLVVYTERNKDILTIKAQTECMCSNADKEFMKQIFASLIEQSEVVDGL